MSYKTGFRTLRLSRRELEKLRDEGKTADIEMVGMLVADDDVTPDLIRQTLARAKVYGRIIAKPDVRQAILSRDVA